MNSIPKGKWRDWRTNKSFVQDLWLAFGPRDGEGPHTAVEAKEFTTAQAYDLYLENGHMKDPFRSDTEWVKMNVRNTLYALIHRQVLELTAPATFRFIENSIEEHICVYVKMGTEDALLSNIMYQVRGAYKRNGRPISEYQDLYVEVVNTAVSYSDALLKLRDMGVRITLHNGHHVLKQYTA